MTVFQLLSDNGELFGRDPGFKEWEQLTFFEADMTVDAAGEGEQRFDGRMIPDCGDPGFDLFMFIECPVAELVVHLAEQESLFFLKMSMQLRVPEMANIFLYPGGGDISFHALPDLPAKQQSEMMIPRQGDDVLITFHPSIFIVSFISFPR